MEGMDDINSLPDGSIMVVDDEPLVREMLARRLTRQGFNVLTAPTADEALSLLNNNNVGIILLDISMPGKSGIEVLPEIKQKWPDTMVIMVTAISDIKIAVEAMKNGAYDYIIKPVEYDVMLLSIKRAIENRRLQIENKEYQLNLEKKVQEQTEVIKQSYLNSIKSLALALEAKDRYTHGHSERVTRIAIAIAERMRLPEEIINKLRLAGLLHDIGKIGVREGILNKPGKLTPEEFDEIKRHCEIGSKILEPMINDEVILNIVRHHHERIDGKGYPDGLVDGEISIDARIMMVADAYDAMSSDRAYRKALPVEVIRAELEKNKGTQFDPQVVDALLQLLDEGIAF